MANAIRRVLGAARRRPARPDDGRLRRQRRRPRRRPGRRARHPDGAGAQDGAGLLGARPAAVRPPGRRDARLHHAGGDAPTSRASTRCSPRWRRAARAVLGGAAWPRHARRRAPLRSTSATRARRSTWRCRSPRRGRPPDARATSQATIERFHALHEELHTYASRDEQPILRGVRVTLVGVTDKPQLPQRRRAAVARRPLQGPPRGLLRRPLRHRARSTTARACASDTASTARRSSRSRSRRSSLHPQQVATPRPPRQLPDHGVGVTTQRGGRGQT